MGGVVGVAWALQCIMGIIVYNTHKHLKSYFLPFIGQEGPKLEIDDTYMNHFQYILMSPPVELPFNSCLHAVFALVPLLSNIKPLHIGLDVTYFKVFVFIPTLKKSPPLNLWNIQTHTKSFLVSHTFAGLHTTTQL